jgi:hypothetical protein
MDIVSETISITNTVAVEEDGEITRLSFCVAGQADYEALVATKDVQTERSKSKKGLIDRLQGLQAFLPLSKRGRSFRASPAFDEFLDHGEGYFSEQGLLSNERVVFPGVKPELLFFFDETSGTLCGFPDGKEVNRLYSFTEYNSFNVKKEYSPRKLVEALKTSPFVCKVTQGDGPGSDPGAFSFGFSVKLSDEVFNEVRSKLGKFETVKERLRAGFLPNDAQNVQPELQNLLGIDSEKFAKIWLEKKTTGKGRPGASLS